MQREISGLNLGSDLMNHPVDDVECGSVDNCTCGCIWPYIGPAPAGGTCAMGWAASGGGGGRLPAAWAAACPPGGPPTDCGMGGGVCGLDLGGGGGGGVVLRDAEDGGGGCSGGGGAAPPCEVTAAGADGCCCGGGGGGCCCAEEDADGGGCSDCEGGWLWPRGLFGPEGAPGGGEAGWSLAGVCGCAYKSSTCV